MDEQEEERIMMARRMARKLARNASKRRTVRKLHGRAYHMRRAINVNKRLTYMLLLGAVMCAYMYDIDLETLEVVMRTVGQEAQEHIPGVKLDGLGLPGLS
jgi:hypothetical protein